MMISPEAVSGNGDERCGISACSDRERETENFQGLYLCFMLISNQIGGSFAVCGITGLLVG
jgi:hypothetical protein